MKNHVRDINRLIFQNCATCRHQRKFSRCTVYMKWAKCSHENNAISVSRLISFVISVSRYKFSKRANRYLLTLRPTATIYNLYAYNEEDFLSGRFTYPNDLFLIGIAHGVRIVSSFFLPTLPRSYALLLSWRRFKSIFFSKP